MIFRVIIYLTTLIILTGCAIPLNWSEENPEPAATEKSFHAKEFTRDQFTKGGVAFAGIVIRQGISVHRYPDLPEQDQKFDHWDQTDFWSHNVEREFAENVSGPTLTPFFKFDDFVEDDLLTSIWAIYSQGGHVSPAHLDSIHSSGTGVRFIFLARVECDDISQDINTAVMIAQHYSDGLGNSAGGGHDPNQANQSLHPTVKRVVGLTLGVFDLETSMCVWEAGTVHHDSNGIDPETQNDYGGFQAKQVDEGEVALVEDERIPNAPAFNHVLDKCLDALFSDLSRDITPNSRRR